jgi:hypothetical protein
MSLPSHASITRIEKNDRSKRRAINHTIDKTVG